MLTEAGKATEVDSASQQNRDRWEMELTPTSWATIEQNKIAPCKSHCSGFATPTLCKSFIWTVWLHTFPWASVGVAQTCPCKEFGPCCKITLDRTVLKLGQLKYIPIWVWFCFAFYAQQQKEAGLSYYVLISVYWDLVLSNSFIKLNCSFRYNYDQSYWQELANMGRMEIPAAYSIISAVKDFT